MKQEKFAHYSRQQWERRHFCSKRCRALSMGRPITFRHWKGGRTRIGKYIYIFQPDHPRANQRGYVMEHRLIMERVLGRYLTPGEHVHHKNGIGHDNREENLEALDGRIHNRNHALLAGLGKSK